jgi:hypothetical protein
MYTLLYIVPPFGVWTLANNFASKKRKRKESVSFIYVISDTVADFGDILEIYTGHSPTTTPLRHTLIILSSVWHYLLGHENSEIKKS